MRLVVARRLRCPRCRTILDGTQIEIGTAKSLDLLVAGYLVARLREHPLPPLPISMTSTPSLPSTRPCSTPRNNCTREELDYLSAAMTRGLTN